MWFTILIIVKEINFKKPVHYEQNRPVLYKISKVIRWKCLHALQFHLSFGFFATKIAKFL